MKRIAAICFSAIMFAGFAQADEQAGTGQSTIKQTGVIGTNTFKECAAVSMWQLSGKSINSWVESAKENDQLDSTIKIPKGWSVVGTSVSTRTNEPLLFICH